MFGFKFSLVLLWAVFLLLQCDGRALTTSLDSTSLGSSLAAVFLPPPPPPKRKPPPPPPARPPPPPPDAYTSTFNLLRNSKGAPKSFNAGQRYSLTVFTRPAGQGAVMQCIPGMGHTVLVVGTVERRQDSKTRQVTWDFKETRFWDLVKEQSRSPTGALIGDKTKIRLGSSRGLWRPSAGDEYAFGGGVSRNDASIDVIANKYGQDHKVYMAGIIDCKRFAEDVAKQIN